MNFNFSTLSSTQNVHEEDNAEKQFSNTKT